MSSWSCLRPAFSCATPILEPTPVDCCCDGTASNFDPIADIGSSSKHVELAIREQIGKAAIGDFIFLAG